MRVKGEGVDAVARTVAKCDDIVFDIMFFQRLHASNVARLQGRKVALHHGHIDGCKKPRSSYIAFQAFKTGSRADTIPKWVNGRLWVGRLEPVDAAPAPTHPRLGRGPKTDTATPVEGLGRAAKGPHHAECTQAVRATPNSHVLEVVVPPPGPQAARLRNVRGGRG